MRTGDQAGGSPERDGFHDIRAAAHATVHKHRNAPVNRLNNLRKRIEASDGTIELATAMVGYDQAIDPALNRFPSFGRTEYALQQQWPPPPRP